MSRGNAFLKKLDRWVGIPAVVAASAGGPRPKPSQIRRIGLLKSAAIGDTLLLAGLVDDLRAAYRDATIVAITGHDNADAARLVSGFDEHILISVAAPLAAARALRAAKLDIIVDFGSWPRFDALLAAASGAHYRVGFRTPQQHRHFAYDLIVDHSDAVHERENYARLLSAIGVTARSKPSITLPNGSGPKLPCASPYVVFHPWAGGYMHQVKEWATSRWVELAQRLSPIRAIVVSGSAADVTRSNALVAAMRSAGIDAHSAAGAYSLAELAHVFAQADAVISVNTGVMHLASLIGAPTVSLEGPTPLRRWRPLGERVRSVESTLPGCGYLNLGFEYPGHRLDCMAGVGADAVYDALTELMSAS